MLLALIHAAALVLGPALPPFTLFPGRVGLTIVSNFRASNAIPFTLL